MTALDDAVLVLIADLTARLREVEDRLVELEDRTDPQYTRTVAERAAMAALEYWDRDHGEAPRPDLKLVSDDA